MRRHWRGAGVAAIVALLGMGAACAAQSVPGTVQNPDFEQGSPGGTPTGWFAPAAITAYDVELADLGAHGGKQAVRITARAQVAGQFGNVMQTIDATPYRGKRIRFSGWVRAEPLGGGAMLWLRVDRPQRQMGFFDNMMDRPITDATWRRYTIVGTVAPDAQQIALGMMLQGMGRAWLDDVTLDTLPTPPAPEPARALSERGLQNLVAFTRLLGYVRFFHPSDEAAATDWDAFAVAGVRAAEQAGNARALAAVLDSLFRPIAPTLVLSAGKPGVKTLAAPPSGATQVVAWRHSGVGLTGAKGFSAYHSDRVRTPLGGQELPDSFPPSPLKPFVAELGGGVTALVPLGVYADASGTLPRGSAGPAPAEPLPPGAWDGNDRAVRLADVALAWNVFQHFYPYFDVAGTDWAAELPRALRRAAADSSAPAFTLTLRRMVAALKDGHGGVSGPGETRTALPPVLLREAQGKVVVLKADAQAAGVRAGDVVLAVDGVATEKALARDEELISGATPQWRRWNSVSRLLLGSTGSPARLEVQHADGSRASLELRRSAYLGQLKEDRPAAIAELKPGIWYLDLERASDADFVQALPKLAEAKGIVFDLRGYPRLNTIALFQHLSKTAMTSAQWHIPAVVRPDRVGMSFSRGREWDIQPAAPYLAAKQVWLTDGRAISYAESTMGIVEHYRLGEIVGLPTAGTNGNVNPFTLPGGYRLSWTGMKVLKHDGSRHHGVGIQPTVRVEPTVAGIAAGRDEQLEKALEILQR